jgi:hypothetical protein
MRSVLRPLAIGCGGLILAALLVMAWQLNALGLRASVTSGSVGGLFDQALPYPGYTWTREGRPVDVRELVAIAGPDHCGWQRATMLQIGWPPGTVAETAAAARQYVRDPLGVVSVRFRDGLVRNARLPADARPTGYRLGSIELHLAPSDQDEAIYVVAPAGAERWPRSDPMTLCA